MGISYVVLHPGASRDFSEQEAIALIAKGLHKVIRLTEVMEVSILLENMAGQGSTIGKRFEQLGGIIRLTGNTRLGVCFDTCHAFAAGYDIRTLDGLPTTL